MNIVEIIFLSSIFVFSFVYVRLVFSGIFGVGNNKKCAACPFAGECTKDKSQVVAFSLKKRYYKNINKK